MVPADSGRVPRARPYSGTGPGPFRLAYGTLTRSGAVFQTALTSVGAPSDGRQTVVLRPPTPVWQRLASWHHTSLGITRFVRHYYGCGSLFLRLLRCFSSPGALYQKVVPPERGELPHSETSGSQPVRGSPKHIGAVPRPSSARSARASIVCSSCLPSVAVCGADTPAAHGTDAVRRQPTSKHIQHRIGW
jgi:hypothetical protein